MKYILIDKFIHENILIIIMGKIVTLNSDSKGRQYKITIPKSLVETMGYQNHDKLELTVDKNQNIILKKVN